MMTREDVIDLLKVVKSYDQGRQVNEVVVESWWEAARRGRWSVREAVEAVHEHHATTTARLMPGHVTERIRSRRAAAPAPKPIEPPRADRAQIRRVAEMWREARERSRASSAARRRVVLAYPDLAKRVADVLGLADASRWSGWVPPRAVPGVAGEEVNDSAIRRELVAVVEEAEERERAAYDEMTREAHQ